MACDFLPNNDDIVRARKISTSMEEITFTKKMKKSVSAQNHFDVLKYIYEPNMLVYYSINC